MKNLFKIIVIVFIVSFINVKGNDGAFNAQGSQLIPIMETDIYLTKELLSIKRISPTYVQVNVYYELYNPKEEKSILVGFEAPSTQIAIENLVNNEQPNIHDFKVMLNGEYLDYKVNLVEIENYYQNEKFIELDTLMSTKSQSYRSLLENEPASYNHVYNFISKFNKGKNVLRHSYKFEMSSSVEELYTLDYILTAASRWANKQIDDFTLIIDMGEFQSFYSVNDNFKDESNWVINGFGNMKMGVLNKIDANRIDSALFVNIRQGYLVYSKKNFIPSQELSISMQSQERWFNNQIDNVDEGYLNSYGEFVFDAKKYKLPYCFEQIEFTSKCMDSLSLKIIRNLPYARRGYVFKDKSIQSYYEGIDWYIPDKRYIVYINDLNENEKEWLKNLSIKSDSKE